MVRQNTFPFYLFLDVFLRGLFRRGISLGSMACLQQRLQADGRIATLPSSLQDIILHLTFRPRKIRCQVRAFVHALMHEECSAAVLRHWQAWLRLQCFYDPPVSHCLCCDLCVPTLGANHSDCCHPVRRVALEALHHVEPRRCAAHQHGKVGAAPCCASALRRLHGIARPSLVSFGTAVWFL